MAPLPASNTARVYVDYNDGANSHTLIVRHDVGVTPAACLIEVDNFIATLNAVLYTITISGARFSVVGSNVTNPVAWPGLTTYGSGTMPLVNAPRQFMWGGKSPDGRLAAWYLFGVNLATPDSYRYAGGVNAALDAAGASIAASTLVGCFQTISGDVPLIKTYVNVNFNSYWEAEPR